VVVMVCLGAKRFLWGRQVGGGVKKGGSEGIAWGGWVDSLKCVWLGRVWGLDCKECWVFSGQGWVGTKPLAQIKATAGGFFLKIVFPLKKNWYYHERKEE